MKKTLSLFEGYGIEIEYIIGNKNNLSVSSTTDLLIKKIAGKFQNEIIYDKIILSNELSNHLIELKTNGPINSICGFEKHFQKQISSLNLILNQDNKVLIPTGMHPFFNPKNETVLWSHRNKKIYNYYDKIFDCKRHGWSNLQSTHINLPFKDDKEFEILHAVIRIVLPIIPCLSASTPIKENRVTGFSDTRLDIYSKNQKTIPSITGKIIPEQVWTKKDYRKKILSKIYQDILIYDTENILKYEWLNSRGAIARFERNTIEIRIIDTQESPAMDFAIIGIIISLIKYLIEKYKNNLDYLKNFQTDMLRKLFLNIIKSGSNTIIINKKYLEIFGYSNEVLAKELWKNIITELLKDYEEMKYYQNEIKILLNYGNLSDRIITALNKNYSKENIVKVYNKLVNCLTNGKPFK
jgi:glutamate---cysteine ligase / carboxylate-amine ligase